jgi:hypothetical protein
LPRVLRARLGLLSLGISVGALLAPAAASAAVTLGPADPNPNPPGAVAAAWGSGATLVPTAGPAGAVLAAPSGGVVTSWKLYTDDVGPDASAQLYALSVTGSHEYKVAASGPKHPVPEATPTGAEDQNVLHVFSEQLPVSAGELLGVRLEYAESAHPLSPVYYLAGGSLDRLTGSELDSPGSATGVTYAGNLLAMNATLEPDVDHDGLGDETQDSCVGDCQPPAPAPSETAVPKKKKKHCGKGKRLKHHRCVKKHKKRHHKRKHGKKKAHGR